VNFQPIVPHHNSTARWIQKHSLRPAHSSRLPIFDHYPGLQHKAPFLSRSLDYMENYPGTSHSVAQGRNCRREYFSKVKELDARCSTFNNPGRDQNNQYYYYITFVGGDNHFCSQETPDDTDPGINKYLILGYYQATAILSTTMLVTSNVSIAAPYWGIPICTSKSLTVKIHSVRYTFFSN